QQGRPAGRRAGEGQAADRGRDRARRLQRADDLGQDRRRRARGPRGDRHAPLKALLVDSWYDVYLGVVVLVRIVDGTLAKGQRIRMMGTDAAYDVDRTGVFTPKLTPVDELGP